MPHELPAVACSLLKESAEVALQELTQAAQEVSSKALGSRWYSVRTVAPYQPEPAQRRRIQSSAKSNLTTPEGLIAGLGCALTRPGHTFQFHQASTAEERSGLAEAHQWSIMLPTSARVVQEANEPLIGIHYPMLCSVKNGSWQIGTVSIREEDQLAAGFRFVNWVHGVPCPKAREAPPPAATNAAHRQIE